MRVVWCEIHDVCVCFFPCIFFKGSFNTAGLVWYPHDREEASVVCCCRSGPAVLVECCERADTRCTSIFEALHCYCCNPITSAGFVLYSIYIVGGGGGEGGLSSVSELIELPGQIRLRLVHYVRLLECVRQFAMLQFFFARSFLSLLPSIVFFCRVNAHERLAGRMPQVLYAKGEKLYRT